MSANNLVFENFDVWKQRLKDNKFEVMVANT